MPPRYKVKETNSNPNKQLGFEIFPSQSSWTFVPNFYPDKFTQMKKKELDRYGGKCGGESVSIKSIKNREFHAEGIILEGEVEVFNALVDYDKTVDLISPLTESGGMECYIKRGELKGQSGWDPHHQQWMFKYTLDLISTGRDEYDTGQNEIVTAITGSNSSAGDPEGRPMYEGVPRDLYEFRGTKKRDNRRIVQRWIDGEIGVTGLIINSTISLDDLYVPDDVSDLWTDDDNYGL